MTVADFNHHVIEMLRIYLRYGSQVTACSQSSTSELWMLGALPKSPREDDPRATLAYCDVTGVRLPFGQWYHEWQQPENPQDLCVAE